MTFPAYPDFCSPAFLHGHLRWCMAFYEGRAIDSSGGMYHFYLDDGTVFDAAAVKTNWERAQAPENACPCRGVAASIKSMAVVDALTLDDVEHLVKGLKGIAVHGDVPDRVGEGQLRVGHGQTDPCIPQINTKPWHRASRFARLIDERRLWPRRPWRHRRRLPGRSRAFRHRRRQAPRTPT